MINWSYFSEMLKNRRERAEEAAGLLKNQPIIRRWHEKANRDLIAAKAQQGPQGQGPQGQGPAPVFRPPNPNAPTAQPRPFILTQKPPPGQANNPATAKWGVIAMPNIPLGRQWAQVYPPARQQAAAQPQPGGGGGAPNAAQPGGQGPANPIATAAGKAAAQPANPFTPHPAYGNTPPIAHPQALIKGNPVVSPARLHANTGRWSNFTYGAKSNKEPGSP